MPSTYTRNTGIEKPADGEQSGSWGDTVNENSDILDAALNGSKTLTLTGTSSTLLTDQGVLSDGQYALLRLSGSPSGTHTITISPSTAQKIYFVHNASGQSVVFTQGSGGNVTVANGDSAIIWSTGAGASSAVYNLADDLAMSSPRITGGTISAVSNPTFESTLTLYRTGGAGGVVMEIGRVDGTAANANIDFHSGATAVDYDARISGSGGTGVVGGGTVTVTAGTIILSGNTTANRLVLNDGYTEDVHNISDVAGAVLDPNNGSIQFWTLGANRTPTQANWASGQSITLGINDGTAYTVNWSSIPVIWKTDGGTAPTLNTDVITWVVLWKLGATVYGARVGDA